MTYTANEIDYGVMGFGGLFGVVRGYWRGICGKMVKIDDGLALVIE